MGTVAFVKKGDIIRAPAFEGTEDVMVFSPCTDLFHVFFCATHQQNLANLGQLEMHLEKDGDHQIAMWCGKRRVYEEAPPQGHPSLNHQLLAR